MPNSYLHGIVFDHGALCKALARDRQMQRVSNVLRRPWRPLLKRCGLELQTNPQMAFLSDAGWPGDVRSALRDLPEGFITPYSLHADTGMWIHQYLLGNDAKGILELGCGVSTVLIALALRAKNLKHPFFSLES